ncbi:E3 ubiquitin-protein ligase UBR4 [Frankliniella fusca]|uniref:E3 ubiquitin-protein ligase UBR4 n=1 Tax=Frankliniella fusca TaxID=407009 RepID=A0AAE1LTH7_9NEOP|nr:E3 ubiquitin-protein ligase UBR4 [Frankliniella fusca]
MSNIILVQHFSGYPNDDPASVSRLVLYHSDNPMPHRILEQFPEPRVIELIPPAHQQHPAPAIMAGFDFYGFELPPELQSDDDDEASDAESDSSLSSDDCDSALEDSASLSDSDSVSSPAAKAAAADASLAEAAAKAAAAAAAAATAAAEAAEAAAGPGEDLGEAAADGPGGAAADGPGEDVSDGPGEDLGDGPGGAAAHGPGGAATDGPGEDPPFVALFREMEDAEDCEALDTICEEALANYAEDLSLHLDDPNALYLNCPVCYAPVTIDHPSKGLVRDDQVRSLSCGCFGGPDVIKTIVRKAPAKLIKARYISVPINALRNCLHRLEDPHVEELERMVRALINRGTLAVHFPGTTINDVTLAYPTLRNTNMELK